MDFSGNPNSFVHSSFDFHKSSLGLLVKFTTFFDGCNTGIGGKKNADGVNLSVPPVDKHCASTTTSGIHTRKVVCAVKAATATATAICCACLSRTVRLTDTTCTSSAVTSNGSSLRSRIKTVSSSASAADVAGSIAVTTSIRR
jgi:hypothetical protein